LLLLFLFFPWPITKGNDWAKQFQKMKIAKENDFSFSFLAKLSKPKTWKKKKNQTLISTLFKEG